jgi:serine/threonine protein kinase
MTREKAPGPRRERARIARTHSDGDESDEHPKKADSLLGAMLAGKYEIVSLLGEGAMGRVYRARQASLDKQIAIKVLHRHLTGEARIAKRFHREARAASRLSHPNSLQILDFGATDDGVLYIAMELLDGEDLQLILDHDFPFTPARIRALLVPVLRALEEAHRAGIIHRDLKPENVVVLADRSGREHVKVCDFGIAKILDGEEGQTITVDGFVCGTPQYMAPEQARGDQIDHRSDIYAAGVVLYQMLCGVVPFGGETAIGIITKHLTDAPVPPRWRRRDLGIPASLEAVCLRAMKKDPAERWATAAEMADALDAAVLALGKDAEQKLGEGPFAGRELEGEERPSAAGSEPSAPSATADDVRITAPRSRRPQFLIAALVTGVGLGIAAWLARIDTPGAEPGAAVHPLPAEPAPGDRGAAVIAEPGTRTEVPSASASSPTTDDDGRLEPSVPSTIVATATATESPSTPDPSASATTGLPRPTRREPRTVVPPRAGAEPPPVASPPPLPPVEPAPAAAETRPPGQIAFEDGRRLFLANEVAPAIARFEEAATLMPRSAEVQKQLGRAYMRAGDTDRSIAAYRRYLALAPDAADRTVVERIIAQHGG